MKNKRGRKSSFCGTIILYVGENMNFISKRRIRKQELKKQQQRKDTITIICMLIIVIGNIVFCVIMGNIEDKKQESKQISKSNEVSKEESVYDESTMVKIDGQIYDFFIRYSKNYSISFILFNTKNNSCLTVDALKKHRTDGYSNLGKDNCHIEGDLESSFNLIFDDYSYPNYSYIKDEDVYREYIDGREVHTYKEVDADNVKRVINNFR